VAEQRKAFYDLIRYAPENLQRRLTELLQSLVFVNELPGTAQRPGGAGSGSSSGSLLTNPMPVGYSVTNVTTNRTFDGDYLRDVDLDEIANLLGTLINDLKNRGVIG
jgi:hypothetical protein